ncbi:MAG: NAD(P)-binding domain-containing protein [Myxococcota bacterium]
MENLPALLCVAIIVVGFVVPMWAYITFTERKIRIERDKAIEAGRHEPVTIQPYVDLSVCMGSGACVPSCPEDVLKVLEGQAVAVNMSACIGHAACVTACPVGAIELVFGSDKRGIDIPRVGPDFQTNVPGVYIAGELGGMGLIASAAEQGIKAMENAGKALQKRPDRVDVAIVGAGPAGIAAAAMAKKLGISYVLLDQEAVGGAVRHYPRKKLVFTRPMDIPGYGKVNLTTLHKEELVELFEKIVAHLGLEVRPFEPVEKVRASDGGFEVTTPKGSVKVGKVLLALGRRGTPRKLSVEGEEQEKVAYSLLEPDQYQYDHLLIVGGGDSAVEAALQLSEQPGNKVFLSYRGAKINRPKEKNVQLLREAVRNQKVDLLLESNVREIESDRVVLEQKGAELVLPNDHVFVMVGGVLPTRFLKDIGIKIQKHYGKRIEAMDDEIEEKSVPIPEPAAGGAPPLSFIRPPEADGGDLTIPLVSHDEPTMTLPPEVVAAAMSAPGPAAEVAPAAASGPAAPPRPVSGLQMLDTHTLPASRSVDELPRTFDEAGGRRKELTEIQPLKRVPLAGGATAAQPSAASQERTVAMPEHDAPDALPEGEEPEQTPGRVVARRDASAPPSRPTPAPMPAPASPISARLSRSRTGAVRLPGRNNPATGRHAVPDEAPAPEAPPVPLGAGMATGVTSLDQRIGAARAALQAGQWDAVQQQSRALSKEVASLAERLSVQALGVASRWVHQLEGEALLASGEWEAATSPLAAAVDAARALEAPEALAQALAAYGRACHHAGRYDAAHNALEEALFVSEGGLPERGSVLRLLGDQALRRGEVEIADQHFTDALEEARRTGARTAEARALRGLANCTAIQGHYAEALEQMVEAFQMLGTDDPPVAASILVRVVELENVLGRYGAALRRNELLMNLTNSVQLAVQRAEGLALAGESLAAVGQNREAAAAAIKAAEEAVRIGPKDPRVFSAGLRAARVLCDVERPADALQLLDRLGTPPDSQLDDWVGQAMAVRARAVVRSDSSGARTLANDAVGRSRPLMAMRAARLQLDAALALHESGANSAARTAVKRGLKVLQGSGNKGLKLELLIAMYLAAPDHRVVEAAARTALRVMEDLPPHTVASFKARPIVGEALGRWSGQAEEETA